MAGPRRRVEEDEGEGGSGLDRAAGGRRAGLVVGHRGCWALGLGGRRSLMVGGRSRASLVGKEGVLATVMLGRWLEAGSRSLPSSDLVERWAYNKA